MDKEEEEVSNYSHSNLRKERKENKDVSHVLTTIGLGCVELMRD